MNSTMQSANALAAEIYTEVFGDIDDKRFRDEKTTEIRDWLLDGDELTGSESAAILGAEWMEYDAETVQERLV